MTAIWNEFCGSFIPTAKSRHRQMLVWECDLDNPKRGGCVDELNIN